MTIADEHARVLAAFATSGRSVTFYTRVKYGSPGYRERVHPHLSMAQEDALVKRFQDGALLVEEHCESWEGNKRGT